MNSELWSMLAISPIDYASIRKMKNMILDLTSTEGKWKDTDFESARWFLDACFYVEKNYANEDVIRLARLMPSPTRIRVSPEDEDRTSELRSGRVRNYCQAYTFDGWPKIFDDGFNLYEYLTKNGWTECKDEKACLEHLKCPTNYMAVLNE
jgi:hypothetical protein